jgi:hypothetical protein
LFGAALQVRCRAKIHVRIRIWIFGVRAASRSLARASPLKGRSPESSLDAEGCAEASAARDYQQSRCQSG